MLGTLPRSAGSTTPMLATSRSRTWATIWIPPTLSFRSRTCRRKPRGAVRGARTARVRARSPLGMVGRYGAGGLDVDSLRMLEDRAYGYFHVMQQQAPDSSWPDRIVLNYTTPGKRPPPADLPECSWGPKPGGCCHPGTVHGLSKMPYLRDTRRSFGLDGFRSVPAARGPPLLWAHRGGSVRCSLMYSAFDYYNTSSPETGFRFPDTIVGLPVLRGCQCDRISQCVCCAGACGRHLATTTM